MRTAVDTNVFVALFSGDKRTSKVAQTALENAHAAGSLAVSPAVYAELIAGGRESGDIERFFGEKGIEVSWDLDVEVWKMAGSRYGEYARERRRQHGDEGPRRILADFLIGSHALLHAEGPYLLTTDTKIFSTYFPELSVISPRG